LALCKKFRFYKVKIWIFLFMNFIWWSQIFGEIDYLIISFIFNLIIFVNLLFNSSNYVLEFIFNQFLIFDNTLTFILELNLIWWDTTVNDLRFFYFNKLHFLFSIFILLIAIIILILTCLTLWSLFILCFNLYHIED
jgi:hypothetical protein